MTPHDIEQMKADREAGTPGPWYADWNNSFWEIHPEKRLDDKHIPWTIGDVCACDPDNTTGLQEINARRIARVPDMEAEILRLREALGLVLEVNPDDGAGIWDAQEAALAALNGNAQ